MFTAIKSSKVIAIHEVEWRCRRNAKGLNKPEYWVWLATVTSGDPPVADFSGEDYTIEETEVDVSSFSQSGHIHSEIDTGRHYHLKWDGSKVVADDDALSACQLAEKWKRVRSDRDRLLAKTDYLAMKDQPDMANDMQIYRKKLRDLPQDNKDVDKITWPTKPS